MSKSVIRHLGEILVCLVDEAQVVPAGVLDCIIGQFTEFASVSHPLSIWQS
jgi:sister-chromatid-cohesion protein PDS5